MLVCMREDTQTTAGLEYLCGRICKPTAPHRKDNTVDQTTLSTFAPILCKLDDGSCALRVVCFAPVLSSMHHGVQN